MPRSRRHNRKSRKRSSTHQKVSKKKSASRNQVQDPQSTYKLIHHGSDNHTFHQFPLLPKELRLQVWKHALPGPRVLDLRVSNRNATTGQQRISRSECAWVTQTAEPCPVILKVCHESRTVGLSDQDMSEPLFATKSPCQAVWVDFSGHFLLLKRVVTTFD